MKNILHTVVTSNSVSSHVGKKTKMVSLCPIYGNERRFQIECVKHMVFNVVMEDHETWKFENMNKSCLLSSEKSHTPS